MKLNDRVQTGKYPPDIIHRKLATTFLKMCVPLINIIKHQMHKHCNENIFTSLRDFRLLTQRRQAQRSSGLLGSE